MTSAADYIAKQYPLTADERTMLVRQIGNMNLLAISGGRVTPILNGVDLPVSNGYLVRVLLDRASDTYIVQRVFRRAGQEWVKGERANVYWDELPELAYRASCFSSYDENEWEVL